MAGEQFIDPAVQQNLEKLLGALQSEQERLGQIIAQAQEGVAQYESMTAEAYAAQVEQARTLAVSRPPGAGSIEDATAAIRQEAAELTRVNELIARQVELQAQAAAAARATAAASVGAPAGQQSVLERLATRYPAAASLSTAQGRTSAQQEAERERLIEQAQRQAAAESKLGAETQRSILFYSQADNQLQRHGALTTDFINAAARGQVTLREFGDQVGATIGKFAGWTGAAAAVYGTFTAVTKLAEGAIYGSNVVGQLHRTIDGLDNQQAGQAIIQLAHDTNVSMKEAGDAVFQFSRTFPNLDDAVYAGGLALRAYKLDGVSVADQVKAQTAIHQQFGITAHGLGPIYDELAAGQREYNARITDQIPLLQRSASAVKNAGGDLQTFIQLSTIALRTTQLSGSQLGTAFLRSASTFLNPATSKGQADRQVLASLGIDPNQNYTSLILEALKRAATLSNSQRQQLSLAIFGPLLGGRTAGFITGGPSLLNEVQRRLSPGAVKGTFLEEFAKELGTSEQQLKALGNNLEQLGAELSQSGLLTPIGLFVKALNEGLTLSTELLKVWSELPGPVKEVAGLAAGAFAARAVTQRAGLTGVPFFGRSAAQLDRAQISAGIRAEQDFYQQQYTGAIRTSATAGVRAQAAERARDAAVATGDETQIVATQRAYLAALERMKIAQQEALVLQQQAIASQAQLNEFKSLTNNGLTAEQAATKAGLDYRLLTLARGAPEAQAVGKIGGQAVTPTGLIVAQSAKTELAAAKAGQDAEGALAKAGSAATGALGKIGSGITNIGRSVVGFVNPWIAGGLAAALGIDQIVKSIEAHDQTVAALQKTVGELPGGIPFSFSADLASSRVEQYMSRLDGSAGDVATFTGNVRQLVDRVGHGVEKTLDDFTLKITTLGTGLEPRQVDLTANNPLQRQLDDLNKKAAAAGSALEILPQGGRGGGQGGGRPVPTALGQAVEAQRQQLERLLAEQRGEFYGGQPAAYLSAQTIQQQVQAAYDNFRSGLISFGELQRTFRNGITELTLNPALSAGDISSTKALIADLRSRLASSIKGIGDELKQLTAAQLDSQIKDYANYLRLFGAQSGEGRDALRHLSSVLGELASRAAAAPQGQVDKSGTTNLDKFAAGQQTITDAIRQQVQADLQFRLRTARTYAERAAAYNAAAADVRQYEVGIRNQITAQARYVANIEKEIAIEKAANAAMSGVAKVFANAINTVNQSFNDLTGLMSGIIGSTGQLPLVSGGSAQLKQLQASLGQHKNSLKFLQDFQKELDRATNDTIAGYKGLGNKAGSSTANPFELTRLRRELQQARDQENPVKAAQDAVSLAHDELAAAKTEKDRLTALKDLATAEDQYNKALADRTQAYYSYLESTTDDPIKQARYEIQAASAAIQNAAAHGGTNTTAYYQALQKYNDAQRSLAKSIEDRKQAYYTYLESQTRDPVRQAQLELAAATEAVANAARRDGVGSQAFYDAKAKQNDAKHKLSDAHLTVSEDNIQFALDLNKISTQTAINEYEHLLKLHNLTLQQRQDLLRKINDLKKGTSSDFSDLNLGTIRLPTPYEIRRAVLSAQSYGATSITNHNDVTIQVPDDRAASAVGVVMDRYVTGTSKALARAKGAR